jgi:hypothetical protein
MPLTLANLRDDLLRFYIDDRGTDRFTNAELLPFLNVAQMDIQDVIDDANEWYFAGCQAFAVTTSATDGYEFTLPTDFKRAIQVERRVSSGLPIPAIWTKFSRRHLDRYVEINANTSSSNSPASSPYISFKGNTLVVHDPKQAYTLDLWYTKRIADLTNDGDESDIPDQYRNLIAIQAAALVSGEGVDGLRPELAQLYQQGLANMRAYADTRQKQTAQRVVYIDDSEAF